MSEIINKLSNTKCFISLKAIAIIFDKQISSMYYKISNFDKIVAVRAY